MDRIRLIEAARKGDVNKLHNLLKDDPYLLRAVALADGDTPLHVACVGGHVNFVREVLNLSPELVLELNQDGFSPLHIVSANGDIEIARQILELGCHLCLVKGKEKRIPLHCAVAKGRIEVIRELLSACTDSITEVTARGETCFHLAVKSNQFEAFKVLVEHVVVFGKEDLLNKRDYHGNTILHLATSRKQYEVVDLLLDKNFGYKVKLEMNLLNKNGLTPLEVLRSEGGDSEIEEMLSLGGATAAETLTHSFRLSAMENLVNLSQIPSQNQSAQEQQTSHCKSTSEKLQDYFKYDMFKDSPSKVRDMLLVIAVLIATATYQAVLSPPGGVWQDDFWPDAKNNGSSARRPPRHTAGQAVMGTNKAVAYGLFLLFNSMGFFMALHMMNFLTIGLPMQFELRVALFALTATYDTCMVAITPNGWILVLFIVLSIVMPFIMPVLTKAVRDYNRKGRQYELPAQGQASS
ncbi:UNVERIFIED_CONTAM: hypothetical protein Scaly_1778100 [Sesamum calycinum]|uniref:PGG domain-containing protein n=1 Tax=Sesamum calycinum TaxID=2727403 RepID=A0AAW2NYY8_9LAMI